MTFFSRKDIGRVYVIRMELPDDSIIHKIGMCRSDRATDRMMEVLRSWFNKYRFVPYTTLRIDMETSRPLELEAHMHKMLKAYQFQPSCKVDGGTEMFYGLDEFRLLHYLRVFDDRMFDTPLVLSDEQYKYLGKWLANA